MLPPSLWLAAAALCTLGHAQSSSSQSRSTNGNNEGDTRAFTTLTETAFTSSTPSYSLITGQRTNTQTGGGFVNRESTTQSSSRSGSSGTSTVTSTGTATGTTSGTITSTSPGSTETVTLLLGGGVGIQTISIVNGTTTIFPNTTATVSTSSTVSSTSATPTNTQPCNGYVEFCNRKYSNITEVATHNAPYVVANNAGSNQDFSVTQQLNDGVRVLTSGVHYVNNTLYNCHTSCDLLNAGPYQNMLTDVASWVRSNPYDVVTILISNSDQRPVSDYVPVFDAAGLGPYIYTPPLIPMRRNDWPTLSQMILRQKRVVVFMDFKADQTTVPWILDQYSHVWQTPFSPVDDSFPCTIAAPDNLNKTTASEDYMYLVNHNLNLQISFAGNSFLIPNTAVVNTTNAAGNETGMLGRTNDQCTRDWGVPPNWLVVDYYSRSAPRQGAVFEAAAKANNVTYINRGCCGVRVSGSVGTSGSRSPVLFTAAAAVAIALLMA